MTGECAALSGALALQTSSGLCNVVAQLGGTTGAAGHLHDRHSMRQFGDSPIRIRPGQICKQRSDGTEG
jgi:hypothetical protein